MAEVQTVRGPIDTTALSQRAEWSNRQRGAGTE